jgi:hypothetical protein
VTGVRSAVARSLAEAGVLLSDQRQERLRREAYATGRRLLPRALSGDGADQLAEAARSLGLAEPVLPRILGFGWQQADGLAELAATPASRRAEVAHLGALFNLGIVVFDMVSDRFPERATLLLRRVTPEFLDAHLGGAQERPPASGDAAIDLLVVLIGEFFSRCNNLGGDRHDRVAFGRLIRAMYGAERFATATRRDQTPPTLRVWRELRRKSALPMGTVAQLALLPEPHADEARRLAARTSARLAGEAVWIVDDLADVHEDWDAGSWSRPLWLLARSSDEPPGDADDALRRVVGTGIVSAEARRLAAALSRLGELADGYGPTFLKSVQATIHAWLEALPD